MSFVIKDDDELDKYNEIWGKIEETLNIKFRSMPVYDEKYIKAKVREFNKYQNLIKYQKKTNITLALPVSLLILL